MLLGSSLLPLREASKRLDIKGDMSSISIPPVVSSVETPHPFPCLLVSRVQVATCRTRMPAVSPWENEAPKDRIQLDRVSRVSFDNLFFPPQSVQVAAFRVAILAHD